jgi:hypothetical protein
MSRFQAPRGRRRVAPFACLAIAAACPACVPEPIVDASGLPDLPTPSDSAPASDTAPASDDIAWTSPVLVPTPAGLTQPRKNVGDNLCVFPDGVVLEVFGTPTGTLYATRSRDGGAHWDEPWALGIDDGAGRLGSIAIGPDANAHLVWIQAGRIRYANTADGRAWSAPLDLATMAANNPDVSPQIGVDALGRVHVTWTNLVTAVGGETASEVQYRRIDSDLVTLGSIHELSLPDGRASLWPRFSVAAARERLAITWRDKSASQPTSSLPARATPGIPPIARGE